MIGQTVSHYRIVEKLGGGGMGVVYKAEDTKLGRTVALKVLPPERVADPNRKRRFIQEARAASALNHPNIITIYDIDEAEGVHYIAMEYVQGKTLDRLIARHGQRVNEALKYAVQMATALAKAHSAGIVHRDLKPTNVMVTDDGLVKVLDFGLAKLTEAAPTGAAETAVTAGPVTEEGTIVGTVGYMSPEQAEGRTVDQRSDIFSFGSVLYEMITGQRAFQGDTKISMISAILNKDPAPLSAEIPHDLERIIARCLRKDPARRFQTMADLKVALQDLKEESDSGRLEVSSVAPKRKRVLWPIAAAGALVCVVAYFFFLRQIGKQRLPAPAVLPLTDFAGYARYPSLSPNGKQVAFSWDDGKGENENVYVKRTDSETALRLTTDPAPDISPAWSPDESQIAFIRELKDHDTIFLISPLGGAERKLADLHPVSSPAVSTWVCQPSVSWSPDGKWLAFIEEDPISENGIFLIPSVGGGKKKLISSPVTKLWYANTAFSPDGRSLAYIGCKGEPSCDLYIQDLGKDYSLHGPALQITKQGTVIFGFAWTGDGHSILYAASPETTGTFRMWRVAAAGDETPELLSWAGDGVA